MVTNTLIIIPLPNRLPTQRLSVSPCFFAAPMGYPVAAGGHRRQKAKSARQRNPIASQRFAPPSSTQKHMRPTQSNERQKTTTLRRSGSFGYGQQVTALRSVSVGLPAAQILTLRPRRAALGWHLLSVPKALRPPQHLSKRYAAKCGQPPQMRAGVRPPCVQWPQLPPVGRVSAHGGASIG